MRGRIITSFLVGIVIGAGAYHFRALRLIDDARTEVRADIISQLEEGGIDLLPENLDEETTSISGTLLSVGGSDMRVDVSSTVLTFLHEGVVPSERTIRIREGTEILSRETVAQADPSSAGEIVDPDEEGTVFEKTISIGELKLGDTILVEAADPVLYAKTIDATRIILLARKESGPNEGEAPVVLEQNVEDLDADSTAAEPADVGEGAPPEPSVEEDTTSEAPSSRRDPISDDQL